MVTSAAVSAAVVVDAVLFPHAVVLTDNARAKSRADAMEREQGSEFRELLKYYFQGIEIVKIAE